MTPARRAAVLAAATVLGAAVPAFAAAAGAPPDDGWVVEAAVAPAGGALRFTGTIEPPFSTQVVTDIEVALVRIGEPALAGCEVPNHREHLADGDDDTEAQPEPPTTPTTEPAGEVPFDFEVPVRCNGRYQVTFVTAEADGPGYPDEIDIDPDPAEERALGEGSVNAAPPDVQGIATQFNATTRVVGIVWQTPAGYGAASGCQATAATDHPDFNGYVVERSIGDAPFAALPIAVPAGNQCYFDQLPADAPLGQYRYRVRASRIGTAGSVLSAGEAATANATVAVGAPPPATTATTAAPPRTGSGGGGVSVGGGRGSTGNAPPGTVPPIPDDGTFEDTLDYDEEPGEEAAQLPDDAEAFLDFVPSPGPGILVPFAIAECLAVWAFHLRYLARRADDGF
jgi:hypothetical protein